ncbi:zinc-binding alcohol dehydrogenase family protein [Sphingobacterium olei]|nr:zinc-binding alcohol dehydrogenase family protein [Sphingobacterium olei]
MMKTLVCEEPLRFVYKESIIPTLTEGEVLIRIKRIGICGTDYHAYQGNQPFFQYPRVLGHELSGVIDDFNLSENAKGLKLGDKACVLPYLYCGNCVACRKGKPNCCTSIQVLGVHTDGGMCEYIKVPEQYIFVDNELSFNELALVEPLAIGAHGVNNADVKADDYVAIIGSGPIGLAAINFAQIKGAKIIVVDINQERLNLCKTKFNVEYTINSLEENTVEAIRRITDGDMCDVVIDATGNLKAINSSFYYLAHTGKYILIGLQKGEISFSHPEFHKREATLMSSRNALHSDFDFVLGSLKNGSVKAENYITHDVSFDDIADKFDGLAKNPQKVIKAMIKF